MNKLIKVVLCFALMCSCSALLADEGVEQYKKDTDALWRTGAGSEDGAFSAISTSMLGWGVGLTVGIAILTGLLHQSTSSTAHSKVAHCH